MNRKLVSTGLLAGLVAGTGAGLILQQTGLAGASNAPSAAVVDDETSSTDPATTDPDATDTTTDDTTTDDTTTDDANDPRPDRGERLTEVLQPLVDDGTLTDDQLAAVISALEAAGPPEGFGRHGHGPGGRIGIRFGLDAAATALGVTVDELRAELQDGSTIADVATKQGVDVQTVIDALVAEATTRLAERVSAGHLTQDEADTRVAELTARITELVNNGRPARPERPFDEVEVEVDLTTADTAAG
jgi:hypothetical protein